MIRGPLKAFLGGTVDPAALLFGPGEYIRQQTAIKKNDPRYTEIYRDATSRRATTYGDRPPSRAWLDHKRGVMKRPPRPPRFPAAADRPGAPARCITTRPPRLAGSVDMVVGQLRKSSAPGSQGASPTDPSLSLSLGRRRRGCNNPRAFARNRGETGSLGTARSATQPGRCSHSGIAPGLIAGFSLYLGRFQRPREERRRNKGWPGRHGGRCGGIVSQAAFRGPGWTLPAVSAIVPTAGFGGGSAKMRASLWSWTVPTTWRALSRTVGIAAKTNCCRKTATGCCASSLRISQRISTPCLTRSCGRWCTANASKSSW